jgi:hypothetical protein
MVDFEKELEKDAKALKVDDESISGIAELGKKAKQLAADISEAEEILKEKKKGYRKLTEEIIPEALTQAGMASFTMVDGSQIEIKEFYSASITKGSEEECFEYLREKGLDDIIQNKVFVDFGRGEDELANRLKEILSKENFLFNQKQSVHHQTLAATFKEQVKAGKPFDLQLFNGFIGRRAVIKT